MIEPSMDSERSSRETVVVVTATVGVEAVRDVPRSIGGDTAKFNRVDKDGCMIVGGVAWSTVPIPW
jgi:hypothetical protein